MQSRSLVIRRNLAGRTVLEILRSQFRLAPADVHHLIKHRAIRLAGRVCRDLTWRVREGDQVQIGDIQGKSREPRRRTNTKPDAVTVPPAGKVLDGNIRIVHADEHVIVVDKPAGLTTVRHSSERAEMGPRAQRFLPNTLVDQLMKHFPGGPKRERLRAVHRLDKETSGLVVLARNAEAEKLLGLHFREHSVGRTYLALVRGQARNEIITTKLVRDRGDGRRGSGTAETGQRAVTHVRVVEEMAGFTLVECRLETGRTHQVRIHLGERGTPLCGERIYDRPAHGKPLPDDSGAERIMLHAATLEFEHPATKKRLHFESPMPDDMRELRKRLQGKSSRKNV